MWLSVLYAMAVASLPQWHWGPAAVLGGLVLGLFFAPLALLFGIVWGALVAAAAEGIDRLPGARPPGTTALWSIVAVAALVTLVVTVGRVAASPANIVGDVVSTLPGLAFWVYGPAALGLVSLVARPLRSTPSSTDDDLVAWC